MLESARIPLPTEELVHGYLTILSPSQYLVSLELLPWMSGINLYDVLYDNLTGVSYPQEAQYLNRTALIKFFEFGKGKVKNISGIDDVLNHPQVEVFKMWVKEGDVIREARNGKERHGVAVICSENEADLERTLEYIEYSLKLELE